MALKKRTEKKAAKLKKLKKPVNRKNVKREIIYKSPDALTDYEQNSRLHSTGQIAQLMSSIERWGFTSPVLIDEHSIIIAGHARVQAAKRLGMNEVPTIALTGLTDAERRAYVIADNKLALNATWDFDVLVAEMRSLTDADFEIDLTGFNELEQASFLDPLSVVADLEGEWEGMPDFHQEDQLAYQTVKVHLRSDEDRDRFSELLQQSMTPKTKFVWYPKAEIDHVVDKRVVSSIVDDVSGEESADESG